MHAHTLNENTGFLFGHIALVGFCTLQTHRDTNEDAQHVLIMLVYNVVQKSEDFAPLTYYIR